MMISGTRNQVLSGMHLNQIKPRTGRLCIGGVLLLAYLAGIASGPFAWSDVVPLFDSAGAALAMPKGAVGPLAEPAARRYRSVSVSPRFGSVSEIHEGDEIVVPCFDGEARRFQVDRVEENVNGTVTTRARMQSDAMGFLLLAVTDGLALGCIQCFETNRFYSIAADANSGAHYLMDLDWKAIERLEGGPSPTLSSLPKSHPEEARRLAEAATRKGAGTSEVDVLVAYTPAAKQWAATARGSIANVLALSMARSNLALDNSQTNLRINLVHSAEIAYAESGDSATDLYRLAFHGGFDPHGLDPGGIMDEVHAWRDEYGADLVTLAADLNDVGGLGFLLTDPVGVPYQGFTLVRVQQIADTETHMHELGHNLGCHHHREQLFQAGPGLFSYSAGWRWKGTDNQYYCDLMTYPNGEFFSDNITHMNVPYFSNPNVAYAGVATGHAVLGDNARTIREIKEIVAAYRVSPNAGGAIRTVPACYDGGVSFRVAISVYPPSGTASWFVEETLPAAWPVSVITEGGVYSAETNRILWGPFSDARTRILYYHLTPPMGVRGAYAFSGTCSLDGVGNAVTGAASIASCASGAILSVLPEQREVSAAEGTTSFAVSNTGEGTMNWMSTIASGADWLEITSAPNGTNAGVIEVACLANASGAARTGEIRVSATGAVGSPKVVRVIQSASEHPVLQVAPAQQTITSAAGVASFTVSNTGFGSMPWTASVSAGASWLTLSSGASGTDSGVIAAACAENTASESRQATITITATGAHVTGSPASVTVVQAGAPPRPVIAVSLDAFQLQAEAGSGAIAVANAGTGTLNWRASVQSGASWLSISSGTMGTNTGTIAFACTANLNTVPRNGLIRITAAEAANSPVDIGITQAAAVEKPALTATPAKQYVDAEEGMTSFSVSNAGTGMMNWTAAVASGASWLSIHSGAAGTNKGTINLAYTENTGAAERTASVTISAPAAVTGSPVTVSVVQLGAAQQAEISVNPGRQSVAAEGGALSIAVSNSGGGEMQWSAQAAVGAAWLSISDGASGTNSGTVSLQCAANTSGVKRTAEIRIQASGAKNSPLSAYVEQAANEDEEKARGCFAAKQFQNGDAPRCGGLKSLQHYWLIGLAAVALLAWRR